MKQPVSANRSRRRLTVRYGPHRPEHIGYSGNISRSGMMIRTTRVFSPGTPIHLEVEVDSQRLRLHGVVVWARAGEVQWLPSGRIGMGVRFVDPPENLMNVIAVRTASR